MQAGDKPDITYRRQKYRRQEPEREEEEVEELEPGQDTMGDQDNPEYNSVVNILNDLAKGQKMMLDLMGQLASHSLEGLQKKELHNGEGSNNGEGSHARTTMHSHPHLYSGSQRPTMPQFLDGAGTGPTIQADPAEPFGAYLQEYRLLGDDFHSAMSFAEFCNMKSRNRPRGGNRNFNNNYELQCTMGKLTIPSFDESSKSTVRAWV